MLHRDVTRVNSSSSVASLKSIQPAKDRGRTKASGSMCVVTKDARLVLPAVRKFNSFAGLWPDTDTVRIKERYTDCSAKYTGHPGLPVAASRPAQGPQVHQNVVKECRLRPAPEGLMQGLKIYGSMSSAHICLPEGSSDTASLW